MSTSGAAAKTEGKVFCVRLGLPRVWTVRRPRNLALLKSLRVPRAPAFRALPALPALSVLPALPALLLPRLRVVRAYSGLLIR